VSVPVGDDAALAEAIRSILNDPARRAAMSAAALQSARESFRIEQTAERLRALYSELTNPRAF
jgi:glycosyltransferase involved in cell wall biosynthesis